MELPLYRHTKQSQLVRLEAMQPTDVEAVRALLNQIILTGTSYPHTAPLTPDQFADYWLQRDAFVVRLCQAPAPGSTAASGSASDSTSKIVGSFYIKPNFPGRCRHICNAGFIVAPEVRGQGIGRLMGQTMLTLARDRGYRAVLYNLVFETNQASLRLWDSLGFQILGRIPEAVHLPDGRYVDALMLYKSLVLPGEGG